MVPYTFVVVYHDSEYEHTKEGGTGHRVLLDRVLLYRLPAGAGPEGGMRNTAQRSRVLVPGAPAAASRAHAAAGGGRAVAVAGHTPHGIKRHGLAARRRLPDVTPLARLLPLAWPHVLYHRFALQACSILPAAASSFRGTRIQNPNHLISIGSG